MGRVGSKDEQHVWRQERKEIWALHIPVYQAKVSQATKVRENAPCWQPSFER